MVIWLLSSLVTHFVEYHILKIHDMGLKVEMYSTICDNVLRVTVCDQLFVFVNDPFQIWIHFLLVILKGIQNIINQCHFLQNNASYNFIDCTATQPISLQNHLNENIFLQNDNCDSNFLYHNSWNRLMIYIMKIQTFLNTSYCMYIKFLLKKSDNKNHEMCLFVADFYTNVCQMSFQDFLMHVMNFQNVQKNHGRCEGIQPLRTVVSIKLCLTFCCKWIVLWI